MKMNAETTRCLDAALAVVAQIDELHPIAKYGLTSEDSYNADGTLHVTVYGRHRADTENTLIAPRIAVHADARIVDADANATEQVAFACITASYSVAVLDQIVEALDSGKTGRVLTRCPLDDWCGIDDGYEYLNLDVRDGIACMQFRDPFGGCDSARTGCFVDAVHSVVAMPVADMRRLMLAMRTQAADDIEPTELDLTAAVWLPLKGELKPVNE